MHLINLCGQQESLSKISHKGMLALSGDVLVGGTVIWPRIWACADRPQTRLGHVFACCSGTAFGQPWVVREPAPRLTGVQEVDQVGQFYLKPFYNKFLQQSHSTFFFFLESHYTIKRKA